MVGEGWLGGEGRGSFVLFFGGGSTRIELEQGKACTGKGARKCLSFRRTVKLTFNVKLRIYSTS